jgi:hypothetical protein
MVNVKISVFEDVVDAEMKLCGWVPTSILNKI